MQCFYWDSTAFIVPSLGCTLSLGRIQIFREGMCDVRWANVSYTCLFLSPILLVQEANSKDEQAGVQTEPSYENNALFSLFSFVTLNATKCPSK